MAVGVLNRLAARGVSVPADISIVGFDDIEMSAMTTEPLTTVRMPMEAAGRAAVDLLLDGLDGVEDPDGTPTHRWLGTQLIVRSTTAPPRAGGTANGASRDLAGR
jgi:DNA-binding LacI/PurR family transcriptional regulator